MSHPQRPFRPHFALLVQSAPVGCYLYVQGHLDVEQVLVLSQVLGHLTLQVPQLRVQMAYSVL